MAWRNFILPICDCLQSEITNWTGIPTQTTSGYSISSTHIPSPNWCSPSSCNFTTGYLYGDSSMGMNMVVDDNTNYMACRLWLNGSQINKQNFYRYNSTRNKNSYFMAVDDETELGLFGVITTSRSDMSWNAVIVDINNNIYRVLKGIAPSPAITSNGGGATHIAKRAGLLSSIGASNLSDILMVSGGGGGGLIIGDDVYAGKDAGGISGNGNNSANQTTGYAFGQGESDDGVSGGGGGLYGGYKGGTS